MTPDLEIRIEVLALHDLGRLDERALRQGVEAELGRLLLERGLPDAASQARSERSLDAGAFDWDGSASTQSLAGSIALRLYHGLAQ